MASEAACAPQFRQTEVKYGVWPQISARLFRVWAAVHSGCQSGRFSGRFREQTGYSGPCRALSGSSINRPGRGPERPGLGPAEQERGRPEVPQNHIRFSYYKCAGYYMGLWVSGCFVVHPDNCSVQVRYVCQLAQYASGFFVNIYNKRIETGGLPPVL